MAEVITETILPGTYIEVRAEGLITVGAIATGNVGIVGSAEKGPLEPVRLSSMDDAQAIFGRAGDWDASAPVENLGLVRALRYVFANGARTVIAARLSDTTATSGTLEMAAENGTPLVRLVAKTPGAWSGRLQVKVSAADEAGRVQGEKLARANDGSYRLTATAFDVPEEADARIGTVTVRHQGVAKKYAIVNGAASEAEATVQLAPAAGRLTFAVAPPAEAKLTADYGVPASAMKKVELVFDSSAERYLTPSAAYLVQQIETPIFGSSLVSATWLAAGMPANTPGWVPFSAGKNGATGPAQLRAALDRLVEQEVQILHVAGQSFSGAGAAVLAHLEKTENLGRERIAVVGADVSTLPVILENAAGVADKRLVLVAPGLMELHDATGQDLALPPAYAAAAVTGRLAGLAPHISLTNKTLMGVRDTAIEFNYGEKTTLVQNRVLTLERKRGVRVIKGISTDDGAFKQISIRRIVDYAKQGTRLVSNQFIGRLNNQRVRDALHTALDSFLAGMVNPMEYLVDYELEVRANRAMQIAGEVQVSMTLMPTFSIDVIRVTMNLQ